MLKAVTGGIPTIHFGYKTSGIRGAELLLDSIERGEQIPIEMKLGFRLVGADPSDSEIIPDFPEFQKETNVSFNTFHKNNMNYQ